jgi:hypothetical protein
MVFPGVLIQPPAVQQESASKPASQPAPTTQINFLILHLHHLATMRYSLSGAILAFLSLGAVAQAGAVEDVENFVRNYERSLEAHDQLEGRGLDGRQTTCTTANARVRKSW